MLITFEKDLSEDSTYETYELNKNQEEDIYYYNLRNKEKANFKKENKQKDILVLWDIENINFYDDYKVISKYIDDTNSIKYIVGKESNKYPRDNRLSNEKVYPRLRKRKWIIDKKNKKVDERLIAYYYKHKNHINKLILITDDSDFKNMIDDAIKNNIEVQILNLNKNNQWIKKYTSSLLIN